MYREYRRNHGFSCPPHPFQFLAWGVVIYFVLMFFLTIIPQIILALQITIGLLFGITMVCHVMTHLMATLLDPADINLRKKQKAEGTKPVPPLDKTKHKHVIENYFCNLCEIKISNNGTKHCSTCNKCIEDFDHHCKWLNNCVGSRNYKLFIITLISAAVGLIIYILMSIFMIATYFTDVKHGKLLRPYQDYYSDNNYNSNKSLSTLDSNNLHGTGIFKVLFIPSSDLGFLLVHCFTIVLGIAAVILLFQLLDFHVYLYKNGLSTYDYIMGARGPKTKIVNVSPDTSNNNIDNSTVPNGVSDKKSKTTGQDELDVEGSILSPTSDSSKSAFRKRQNKIVPSPHSVHWQDEENSNKNNLGAETNPQAPLSLYAPTYDENNIQISPLHADIHTKKKPFSLEPLPSQVSYNQLKSDSGGKKRKRSKRRHRPLPQLPALVNVATVGHTGHLATIPDGEELPLSSVRAEVAFSQRPSQLPFSAGYTNGFNSSRSFGSVSTLQNDADPDDEDLGNLADLPTLGHDYYRAGTQSSLMSSSTSSLYSTGLATPVSNFPAERRSELRRAMGVPLLNLGELAGSQQSFSIT